MAFDWFAFLRQNGVPFTTTGPNVSRGRVNIKCPFCGSADPSEHLGISLSGRGWSCWRNEHHRGKSESRLVATLLHCSFAEAETMVQGASIVPADDDLMARLRTNLGDDPEYVKPVSSLTMPKSFKPLGNGSMFALQFLDYMKVERHYKQSQLHWLFENYDLRYTTSGRFAYRVIIPYYDRWRELLTWTGRTILKYEEQRYKTLKRDEQVCSPKETLLGLPLLWNCSNPRALLVCEGPFDALWLTSLGHPIGIYATCLSGLTLSEKQTALLIGLKSRFKYIGVLLDSAASFQAFRMSSSGFDLGVELLPQHIKDPAEFPPGEVLDFYVELLNKHSMG